MANTQTTVPLFVANTVLTAASQNISAGTGVPVFATTVTRDAAFGGSNKALAEGQLCYIEASNIVQYYTGAAWATVGPTASKIAQVVTTALPTTFSASVAAGSQTAVTGLSVSITPTLATSTILVMATVTMATTTGANSMYFSLTRDATKVGVGTAASARQTATGGAGVDTTLGRTNSGGSIQYIDSPATTSATTYAVTVGHTSGVTQTVYVNRSDSDGDFNYIFRTISTITVMEVLA